MAEGSGIGNRIRSWYEALPMVSNIIEWIPKVKARALEVHGEAAETIDMLARHGQIFTLFSYTQWLVIYILTGWDLFKPKSLVEVVTNSQEELQKFQADPQGYLQEKLHEFGTSPQTQAFTEFIGTIITEPVVSLLEDYAGRGDIDPHQMARSFHGIASGLPWAAESFDSVLRAILGDRAPSVGKQIMALYWGLGLGFLGWQTLAPLLSNGLQPNLERYYNRLYRPARFSPSQVRDLFALDKMSAPALKEYLQDQGWRDEDIQTWIDLSYRELSEGVVWDLYEKGVLTQADVEARMRAKGYNPTEIPYLFKAHEKEDTQQVPKTLRSTLKNSFKEHLISEQEFREGLSDLNYSEREIELQIQLLTTEKETELRELTVGQVKALYNNRIISGGEAKHHLLEQRLAEQSADLLIKLWDAENVPKPVRINRGTIREAFRYGVLDRETAKKMLQSETGLSATQAELVVKTEEAAAAAREPSVTVSSPAVSIGTLRQFARAGLITRDELLQRPELERFNPQDRQNLADLFFADIGSQILEASDELLLNAYVFGLVTREELATRLEARGLSAEDTELAIRTVELDNPSVFGEFVGRYLRQPSISQLTIAFQREIITEDQYRARLQEQGYTLDAIELYVENASFQAPTEPRELTTAQVLNLYDAEKFTRDEAHERLVRLGYRADDASLLIELEAQEPIDTEVGQAYVAGFINQGNVAVLLADIGFTPDQIQEFFDLVAIATQ